MKVGLLTPARMPAQAVATAESLRTSAVGLAALIGFTEAKPSPRARRIARHLRRGAAARGSHSARRYADRYGIRYSGVWHPHHPAAVRAIEESGADVIVAFGAGILRPVLLDLPGRTFVNAHAGRLPQYGGMNVVEWAVYRGDPIYGTVHRIDAGIDTGDVLLEAPLVIGRPDSISALRTAAFAAAWALVPAALEGLAAGRLAFRPQPDGVRRVQWFRMHRELLARVERRLRSGSSFAVQEAELRARDQGSGVGGQRSGVGLRGGPGSKRESDPG